MQDQVTIRMAGAADAPALHALEELNSGRLADGDVLVAEVSGEVHAALPVAGGRALADPFRPTRALVELLEVHAAQLRAAARPAAHATTRPLAVAAR